MARARTEKADGVAEVFDHLEAHDEIERPLFEVEDVSDLALDARVRVLPLGHLHALRGVVDADHLLDSRPIRHELVVKAAAAPGVENVPRGHTTKQLVDLETTGRIPSGVQVGLPFLGDQLVKELPLVFLELGPACLRRTWTGAQLSPRRTWARASSTRSTRPPRCARIR